MCILNRHQFMQYVLHKKWRKIDNTCKMTVHKEHHSSMYAATLCKKCGIVWKISGTLKMWCLFKQAPIHAICSLQIRNNKIANSTCKKMLHTEHYSSMYATTLCKKCGIRWKMRSITSQFQGKPSYKHFRNHSRNVVCFFARLNFL